MHPVKQNRRQLKSHNLDRYLFEHLITQILNDDDSSVIKIIRQIKKLVHPIKEILLFAVFPKRFLKLFARIYED